MEQGLTEIDPAVYCLSDGDKTCGVVCSHVDDLIWAGDHKMDKLMSRVQQRFTFGFTDAGNFRFCGRKIESTEEHITVSSPETLGKTKPVHVDRERMRQPSDHASSQEQSQMRAVLGSIAGAELHVFCTTRKAEQPSGHGPQGHQ